MKDHLQLPCEVRHRRGDRSSPVLYPPTADGGPSLASRPSRTLCPSREGARPQCRTRPRWWGVPRVPPLEAEDTPWQALTRAARPRASSTERYGTVQHAAQPLLVPRARHEPCQHVHRGYGVCIVLPEGVRFIGRGGPKSSVKGIDMQCRHHTRDPGPSSPATDQSSWGRARGNGLALADWTW